MKVVRKRKVMIPKKTTSPYLRGATPEQRRWLKSHTITDLEEIVETLEYQGENVERIRQVISDLKAVAAGLGIQISSYADYDLLEFVKAEESKATA
jgi:hypothetical protein